MTTVLKKALAANGANFDDLDAIKKLHDKECVVGKKRHYFLGGLLHINGIEIDGSLGHILRDYTNADSNNITTYLVTINVERNGIEASVGETADQMHNLKNEPMTSEGREAAHLIIADDALLDVWEGMNEQERLVSMRNHFSKIVLTGYSYGTSLIQQMERDLVDRLRQRNLPLEPLNLISAVNIGPVDIPACDNGLHAEFNNVSGPYTGKRQGFTQLFALKSIDKIMDSVIGKRLVPDNHEGKGIVAYGDGRLTFAVDYNSDAQIRRIGNSKFPDGREVPRVNMEYDPEAHDIRVYLNRKRILASSSGKYVTYPTSPLSTIVRDQMYVSLSNNSDHINTKDWEGVAETDIGHHENLYNVNFDYADLDYKKLRGEFEDAVHTYEQAGFKEAIVNINQLLDETARSELGADLGKLVQPKR